MSGTLELAAGVLAIVGAADVAVRTGREVHGFLRNIAGAPEEINRLCATVKEVAILAETAKQLLCRILDYSASATHKDTLLKSRREKSWDDYSTSAAQSDRLLISRREKSRDDYSASATRSDSVRASPDDPITYNHKRWNRPTS
ncbi:hypothetical protein A1F94_011764 [Pyrenophora tritici-repentis]|nr:hypothetical protein A1F94_011764 [Pyrenophora tritici-repentis]